MSAEYKAALNMVDVTGKLIIALCQKIGIQ